MGDTLPWCFCNSLWLYAFLCLTECSRFGPSHQGVTDEGWQLYPADQPGGLHVGRPARCLPRPGQPSRGRQPPVRPAASRVPAHRPHPLTDQRPRGRRVPLQPCYCVYLPWLSCHSAQWLSCDLAQCPCGLPTHCVTLPKYDLPTPRGPAGGTFCVKHWGCCAQSELCLGGLPWTVSCVTKTRGIN